MILDDEVRVLGALGAGRGGSAVALAGLVRDAVAAGVERQVLVLRGRRLARSLHPRQRALLREAWEPLRHAARTQLFELPGGDVVAIAAPGTAALDRARDGLLRMLEGEEAGCVQGLRLPAEAAALLGVAEEALGMTGAEPAAARPHGAALEPEALAMADRALAAADLAGFMRRQRVCQLPADGRVPEPLAEHWRIATEAVCEALLPGLDPAGAPWLMRRLRRVLDRRLLAELARSEALRGTLPVSLSLVPESLVSAEFRRFDLALPQLMRGQVTIGLAASDLLADPPAAAFARGFAEARGYRLALEAASAAALAALPPGRSGMALRLAWSEALPLLDSPEAATLRASLPADAVLAGADRPAAVGWGWEMGITRFQGRLMELRRPA